MAIFSYKAIDEDGVVLRGTIESFDLDSAYDDLSAKGLHIIRIKRASEFISRFRRGFRRGRIKRLEVIEFVQNLSIMLKAGIPLLSALQETMAATKNKHLQKRIDEVRRMTEMGMGFAETIEAQKGVFPPILGKFVKVGEETGRLDEALSNTVEHLKRTEALAASLKKALIYPVFVMVASIGALTFWLVFVLPKIMATLIDMGIELPTITRVLLRISEVTQRYWYLIFLLPLIIFIMIQIMKRYEALRYYIDLVKLKFPIIKILIYNRLLALFFEHFYALSHAGFTIDMSFSIVADTVDNSIFKRAITRSKEAVAMGSSIANALKEHEIFPPLAIGMIDVGEKSGSLDRQLEFLTEHYMKKVDDISAKIGSMLEPILLVVMGLIFAIIIIGLLLPIYDVVSKLPT